MILVDKPYLSDFLKQTITEINVPVIRNSGAEAFGLHTEPFLVSEEDGVASLRKSWETTGTVKLYSTSENAIGWIGRHLGFTGLPEMIEQFKNKAAFRKMIRSLHPDFYFQEVSSDQLTSLDVSAVPLPFIIKPSVGFFSMGVHRVESVDQWADTVAAIGMELSSVAGLYPAEVMDAASFIIEECIEGDEFAVDAYYDEEGEPVILNILEHVFSSADDVSDRVYLSGKAIIEEHLEPFTAYLRQVGSLALAKNFPVHVELRRTAGGELVPIEFNPMRFGGWCTTADLAGMSYGFNPYEYYFSSRRPDWDEVLRGREGMLYAVVVLDNSTGIEGQDIASFDYDKLRADFETVLELRKIDWREYPVFGFMFTQTREDNRAELERILTSDLKEYVRLKASPEVEMVG